MNVLLALFTSLWFMFAVALVAAMAFVYYCVMGVLDKDRLLSRSSAVAFLVFGAVAAVMLVRILS